MKGKSHEEAEEAEVAARLRRGGGTLPNRQFFPTRGTIESDAATEKWKPRKKVGLRRQKSFFTRACLSARKEKEAREDRKPRDEKSFVLCWERLARISFYAHKNWLRNTFGKTSILWKTLKKKK